MREGYPLSFAFLADREWPTRSEFSTLKHYSIFYFVRAARHFAQINPENPQIFVQNDYCFLGWGVLYCICSKGERPTESRKKSFENFKKRLDKPPNLCYNKNVPRERGTARPPKKSLKNLKKRLDKSLNLWYN